MIKDLGGRSMSERTPEEEAEILMKEMATLSPEEKETLFLALKELGDPAFQSPESGKSEGLARIYDALSEGEYIRRPVDIRTFVKDPYYLGETCVGLYPKLLEDMEELFRGGYKELILTGCVDLGAKVSCAGDIRRLRDLIDVGGEPLVLSRDREGKAFHARSDGARHSGVKDTVQVVLFNGLSLRLTPEHKVMTRRGWVEASSLLVGVDEVASIPEFESSGQEVIHSKVAQVSPAGAIEVGDIGVPVHHSFFAQGIQVHNSIGYGKCIHGSTEVYDVGAGRRRRADEIGEYCVASMLQDGKISGAKCSSFRSGRKECVTLKLSGGQRIILSKDHKVFTSRGWVEAGSVTCDDLVGTPRRLPPPSESLCITDEEVKLAAYLLSDGGVTTPSTTFTNETPAIYSEMDSLVAVLGDSSGNDKYHKWIVPGMRATKSQNSGKATTFTISGLKWFRDKYGISGHARDKRVPAEFYGLNDRQIGLFLNRFWACDGSFYLKSPIRADVALASEGMIDDLRFLLLRLGIPSRKYSKMASYKLPDGSRREFPAWTLTISDRRHISMFCDLVGPVLGKEDKVAALAAMAKIGKTNTNVDIVPIGIGEIREIREDLGDGGTNLTSEFGCPGKQKLSRDRFERLCSSRGYVGRYSWLASTDLLWERVDGVDASGEHDVYDLSVPDNKCFVGNGIVVHNTFMASIVVCRILYELSCLRDPHRTLGIAKDTNISIIALSVSETLAIKVVFENLATKLKASKYFEEHFKFEETKKELRFPHNILVAARATTSTAVLGMNVLAAIMDEGNFFENIKTGSSSVTAQWGNKDKARAIYDQLVRRWKSRFQKKGRLPGMMILISSKRTKDDFTAKRIAEAQRQNDLEVFIRDYAIWNVVPDNYSAERFQVLVGNANTPSRMLPPEEVDPVRKKLQDGMLIVDVPLEFKPDFESDLENSLRDIAGVETVSISPFIQQVDRIPKCIDTSRVHPFSVVEWDQSKGGSFIWERIARRAKIRDGASEFEAWQPIHHPGVTRHAHIDPSLNSDATGITVGCVAGYKYVQRRNFDTMELYTEAAPMIWIDFVLRIIPPAGGEIDHGMMRGLIYQLQEHGFPIGYISLDQWNCLKQGTPIHTSRGILPIEEVAVGDLVESRIGPRPVEKVFSYSQRPTIRIFTKDGDVIEGTENHKIEVQCGWGSQHVGEYGDTRDPLWQWKRFEELAVGDVVHMSDRPTSLDPQDAPLISSKEDCGWVSSIRTHVMNKWITPTRMSPEFSEFLGLIWGDGDIGGDFFRLSCHVDDLDDAKGIFSRIFGGCPNPIKSPLTDKCYSLRFGSKWFVKWLTKNGLNKPTIPSAIMRSSKAVKAAFLRGLFSADGNVSKTDGEVQLSTDHYDLAQQVRLILRVDFNIESCLVTMEKKYDGQKKLPGWHGGLNYYVSVRGPRSRFMDNIGFCYHRKREALEKFCHVKGRRKFTRVVKIEHGVSDVFDIQVKDDPSYIANGFVSHNSVASIQKFVVKGIEAERVSVDRPPDAYEILKSAIYEQRISMYEYEPLLRELRTVQHDRIKNKIDHPRSGSKDTADSLAGVAFSLTTKYRGQPMGVLKGITSYNDKDLDEQAAAIEPDGFMMPFLC